MKGGGGHCRNKEEDMEEEDKHKHWQEEEEEDCKPHRQRRVWPASFPLLKWPWLPKYVANFLAGVMVYGCTHMPLRQHNNGSNTFYMPNMDVWSGLRWISASTMTLWHHFHSSCDRESPNLGWGQLGRCNCIRVHPYSLETAYQWRKHFVYV